MALTMEAKSSFSCVRWAELLLRSISSHTTVSCRLIVVQPMSMRRSLPFFPLILLSTAAAFSAPPAAPDLEVIHHIKTEAFNHSKVMDTLESISDRYGPRLTASPEFEEAAHWAESTLKSYGLTNVHEEKWGPFGRSWSLQVSR